MQLLRFHICRYLWSNQTKWHLHGAHKNITLSQAMYVLQWRQKDLIGKVGITNDWDAHVTHASWLSNMWWCVCMYLHRVKKQGGAGDIICQKKDLTEGCHYFPKVILSINTQKYIISSLVYLVTVNTHTDGYTLCVAPNTLSICAVLAASFQPTLYSWGIWSMSFLGGRE